MDTAAPPDVVWTIICDGVPGRLLGRLTRGITNRHLAIEASGPGRRSEATAWVSGP